MRPALSWGRQAMQHPFFLGPLLVERVPPRGRPGRRPHVLPLEGTVMEPAFLLRPPHGPTPPCAHLPASGSHRRRLTPATPTAPHLPQTGLPAAGCGGPQHPLQGLAGWGPPRLSAHPRLGRRTARPPPVRPGHPHLTLHQGRPSLKWPVRGQLGADTAALRPRSANRRGAGAPARPPAPLPPPLPAALKGPEGTGPTGVPGLWEAPWACPQGLTRGTEAVSGSWGR